RRCDLPRRLQQGVVPGGDESAHAHRFVDELRPDGGVARIDDTAGLGVRDATEVVEAVRDVVHVDPGLDDPLPGVVGLRTRELLLPLADGGRGRGQESAALRGGDGRPDAGVEGAARGLDRGDGVRFGRLVDGRDELAVRGAVDVTGAAVQCGRPGTIDVQGGGHGMNLLPSVACMCGWEWRGGQKSACQSGVSAADPSVGRVPPSSEAMRTNSRWDSNRVRTSAMSCWALKPYTSYPCEPAAENTSRRKTRAPRPP